MSRRNAIVDILRFLAAWSVVTLHYYFPGRIGFALIGIARFAVPFFYLVSGYFYAKEDKNAQYKSTGRKVKHIAGYLIFVEGVSFASKLSRAIRAGYPLFEGVRIVVTDCLQFYAAESWRAYSLTPLFNYSAWFLVQLIAVYLLYALLTKLSLLRTARRIALFGFLFGFLLLRIGYALGLPMPPYLDYFIFFMGFPFFTLGYCMKETPPTKWIRAATPSRLTVLLLAGCILSIVERDLLPKAAIFLGSVLINFALCLLFIRYADHPVKSACGRTLAFLGNKLSFFIYIFHSKVGSVIHALLEYRPDYDRLAYVEPIMVCVATTVFSLACWWGLQFIKKHCLRGR